MEKGFLLVECGMGILLDCETFVKLREGSFPALMGDCGELEQSWSWETMFCKVCLPAKISRGRKQEYKLKFKRTSFPEYLTLFQHKIGRNKRGHAWNTI